MNLNEIDLHDPQTMAFDERPEDFVRLDCDPIVFTVAGIRHFTPRMAIIGVKLRDLQTAEQFHRAYASWVDVETMALASKIERDAAKSHQANEHQILLAVLQGNPDEADRIANKLLHKKKTHLHVID